MTDHELLKLAAKAAEIELRWDSAHGENPMYQKWRYIDNDWTEWNPLVDDGEAFRLAVSLSLKISITESGFCYIWKDEELLYNMPAFANNSCERNHIMRRCIVSAAAEIGKRTE